MTTAEQTRLYTEYRDRVYGYIYARVRSREEAEDLCADVFEKALRAGDRYDSGKAAPGTWLFTITRCRRSFGAKRWSAKARFSPASVTDKSPFIFHLLSVYPDAARSASVC